MLTNPNPARRLAGKAMIIGAIAVALPLTATWATRYVDVEAPTAPTPPTPPSPATAPEAPLPPLPPLPAAAPLAPEAPLPPLTPVAPRGKVVIDGRQIDWNQLSPAEKARIRASLDEARRGLAASHIDRAAMRAELQKAMAEVKNNRSEMRRDLDAAKREVDQAMREIDASADDIRRAGQDPEAMKALVRASLKSVEHIDVEAITRTAMARVDPALIERSIAAAEAGIARAQAEIDAAERGN